MRRRRAERRVDDRERLGVGEGPGASPGNRVRPPGQGGPRGRRWSRPDSSRRRSPRCQVAASGATPRTPVSSADAPQGSLLDPRPGVGSPPTPARHAARPQVIGLRAALRPRGTDDRLPSTNGLLHQRGADRPPRPRPVQLCFVVGGQRAIPTLPDQTAVAAASRGRSSMAESQPSKLVMRVRFPSPAPVGGPVQSRFAPFFTG